MIGQQVSKATADTDLEVEIGHNNNRQPKWTMGLDKGKQMYCMALAQQDNLSRMEDCSEDDLLEYQK